MLSEPPSLRDLSSFRDGRVLILMPATWNRLIKSSQQALRPLGPKSRIPRSGGLSQLLHFAVQPPLQGLHSSVLGSNGTGPLSACFFGRLAVRVRLRLATRQLWFVEPAGNSESSQQASKEGRYVYLESSIRF